MTQILTDRRFDLCDRGKRKRERSRRELAASGKATKQKINRVTHSSGGAKTGGKRGEGAGWRW